MLIELLQDLPNIKMQSDTPPNGTGQSKTWRDSLYRRDSQCCGRRDRL